MKKPVFAAISCLALLAVFPACDQHTWEDSDDGKTIGTKRLFEKHGHGDDHKKGDKHAGEEKHAGEKAEAAAGAKKEG